MFCLLHKSLGFIRKIIWLSWFIQVGFLGPAVFARVPYSEDKVQRPESSSGGFLCISECATCPAICFPPPPPLLTSSSYPPSHSPSPSYFAYSPPPPRSQAPPSPPLPALPPSSPSSHSAGATPPPLPSGKAQPTVISGPHEYSYPYYHFYSSDAASLPASAPFFMSLSFLHWLIFCL